MLTGYCNRCGAGCVRTIRKKVYACENLIRYKPVGEENATACAVHGMRYEGMPIRLVAEDGDSVPERCVPDYPQDGEKLLPTCSYKV